MGSASLVKVPCKRPKIVLQLLNSEGVFEATGGYATTYAMGLVAPGNKSKKVLKSSIRGF